MKIHKVLFKKSIIYSVIFAIFISTTGILHVYNVIDINVFAAEKKKKTTKKKSRRRRKRVRKFSLNFKDVEIKEFLKVMSEIIKKNIIVDDKVRGKITVNSAKEVPISQAYEIMKSILELKGLAVVETPNLLKIIPVRDAIKKNAEIIVDGDKKISLKKEKTITFLLEIEKADANEVSRALQSLKSKDTTIVMYPSLNTIIISGKSSEVKGLIKIARALDKTQSLDEDGEEKAAHGNIHVVHLQNANAEELAGVLSRIPFSESAVINRSTPKPKRPIRRSSKARRTSTYRPGRNQSKQKLSIIANKETNSLIIYAKPEEFKEIQRVIKKLDIVREQVLIEALIVEVSADNNWNFGIDWMLGAQTGNHIGATSQINNIGNLSGFGSSPVEGKELPLPVSSGFQLGYLSDKSILSFAILNAAAADRDVNILSTPQILTVDNEEAELNVGEEIAIPTNNRISESGTQFYTYEYKPVGVKLKITPHITQSKQITLDLYQEVNSVIGQADVATGRPPDLGKRDIKTRVTVIDGKTIVVGGLISNQKSVQINKVPLLGDIPLLGWIFKRKSVSYSKRNLLVFITPHIVTKQDRLEAVTHQKREEQKMLRQRK